MSRPLLLAVGLALGLWIACVVPVQAADESDTHYQRCGPGPATVRETLIVTAQRAWNCHPRTATYEQLYHPWASAEWRDEEWTHDGTSLNELEFFVGLRPGDPLADGSDRFAELAMPIWNGDSDPAAIIDLLRARQRAWLARAGTEVPSDALLQPGPLTNTTFVGAPGFTFDFAYRAGDGVDMRGIVSGAVLDGRLYLVTFEAPALHYFPLLESEVRALMASARLAPPTPPA